MIDKTRSCFQETELASPTGLRMPTDIHRHKHSEDQMQWEHIACEISANRRNQYNILRFSGFDSNAFKDGPIYHYAFSSTIVENVSSPDEIRGKSFVQQKNMRNTGKRVFGPRWTKVYSLNGNRS